MSYPVFAGGGVASDSIAHLAEDDSVSGTTLVNTDLLFAAEASSEYAFFLYAGFLGNNTGNGQISFSGPSGADGRIGGIIHSTTSSFAVMTVQMGLTSEQFEAEVADERWVQVGGYAVTDTTAGNIVIQIAQVINSGSLTLFDGSYIAYWKVK